MTKHCYVDESGHNGEGECLVSVMIVAEDPNVFSIPLTVKKDFKKYFPTQELKSYYFRKNLRQPGMKGYFKKVLGKIKDLNIDIRIRYRKKCVKDNTLIKKNHDTRVGLVIDLIHEEASRISKNAEIKIMDEIEKEKNRILQEGPSDKHPVLELPCFKYTPDFFENAFADLDLNIVPDKRFYSETQTILLGANKGGDITVKSFETGTISTKDTKGLIWCKVFLFKGYDSKQHKGIQACDLIAGVVRKHILTGEGEYLSYLPEGILTKSKEIK